jgi:5,10-methylenetetrahydromethanopterin reductase
MRVDVILNPDSSPWEVKELGLLAEQQGIGAVWTSNYPSSRDPFITLCPLALASRRIRLGPLVVTPYELHPYKIAKALASLNELCGGRANILIGGPTGVNAAMGMGVTRMVGRVRECVEIMKGVSPDQPLNYNGRIFQVWGYRPAWAVDSPPLIYIGANKPQMLRMAARVADSIMVGDPTPQVLATTMATLDQELETAGRRRQDLRISALVAWHVKADRHKSVAEARQQLALRGMLDAWYLHPFLDEEECRFVASHREAFFAAYKNNTPVIEGVPDSITDKLVENLTCCGNEDDIDRHVARLKGFRDLGLSEVALKLHNDQAEAIRLIGKRVVPALQ